jgi:ABC-2 type transport system permease protein
MNRDATRRNLFAVRRGLGRGWLEFKMSMRSPQDQGFYLFMGGAALIYLTLRRNTEVEGTDLLLPSVAVPSILGAMLAFGLVVGPAFQLAGEREDGTLLRAKAMPRGMLGHVVGHILTQMLSLIPALLVILLPAALLFDGLMHRGAAGWFTMLWVLGLGMLATLPIGIIIGSVVPSTQKVASWGMLPVIALAGTSGIFYPVHELWGWLQGVVQVFPMYWLGLGVRSAFLPDSAAALELGGSWRTLATVGVLGAWAAFGLLLAPMVLRRMARRQSGSQVEAAKQAALQWVR